MTESIQSSVLCSRDQGIVHIRFNRPSVLNAVNADMSAQFLALCREIESDKDCRVVVLSGVGKSFMAGGDLASLQESPLEAAGALIKPLNEGLAILARVPQPVIASLHGSVAGAGVGVALGCDLAIAADNTRFNLAYAKVGTSLDASSSWALPRVVGLRKAMELSLLADTFDSEEALRMGLINRVVPVEQLAEATTELARRLSAGPTIAYGKIKHLLRTSFDRELSAHLDAEYQAFCECTQSKDFAEGMSAFFDKRKAMFLGR